MTMIDKKLGRPTDYRDDHCEKVIQWGREGKSKIQIASLLEVTRITIDRWIKTHEEFADAMELSKVHSQAWFEDKGQAGLDVPGFNASLWNKQMTCRFTEDYPEIRKHEITGANGGAIEFKKAKDLSDDELAAIIRSGS